jgi:cytochrome c oxidase cbb3-type subunit 3
MSDNKDRILGHGDECDGIEEYDNALPAWWLGLFYFTIIWGVVYAIHYHFVGQRSQAAEYDAEIAAAAEMWPTQEAVADLVVTADVLAEGKALYDTNCVGCHGPDLKGGIGPDLTDAEWIHGSTMDEITATVTDGVPEKGMLAWGPILGPDKVQKVSAYIHDAGGGS